MNNTNEKDLEELKDVVEKKLNDAQTPGAVVEMDPDEADFAGAFKEDAMSFEDAFESSTDGEVDE